MHRKALCYSQGLSIALCLLMCIYCKGQVGPVYGTDFWMGFMDTGNGITTELHISSEISTCGTVTIPKQGWSKSFTVSAGTTTVVVVPSNQAVASGSETIENKGVHITSLSPVNVVSLNHRGNNFITESTLIIPTTKLGTDYTAFSHDGHFASQGPEILVVGVANNTTIQVTSTAFTTGGKNVGVPFTFTINQGEVYQIKSPGYFSAAQPTPPGDFTGTRVISTNNQPFALFGGSYCSDVSYFTSPKCCCDPLIEQYLPVASLGTEYLTAPIKTRNGDYFKILATQNGTTVQINGGASIALNANQFIDTVLYTASYINGNIPFALAQYSRSGTVDGVLNGDPFLIQLHPLGSEIKNALFPALSSTSAIIFYYANIITKTTDITKIKVDGSSIAASFSIIASNPAYSFAQLTLNANTHNIHSTAGFLATSYGYGGPDGYGFTVGDSRLNTNAKGELADTIIVCPNVSVDFSGYAIAPSTNWMWSFGDGNTSTQQNPSHAYVNSGNFTATVLSSGGGFPCTDTIRIPVKVGLGINLTINNSQPSFCLGDSVTLTANAGAGNYIWNTGATTQSITVAPLVSTQYKVVGGSGNCKDSVQITIAPTNKQDATINTAGPFCSNGTPVNLTSITSGGVWSGTGITNTTNGTFDPAIAGAGSHQITYMLNSSCGDTATINIVVTPKANASINATSPFCVSDQATTLSAIQNGGSWSGTGITNATSGLFNPSIAGTGNHLITYTIPGTCGDTSTISITVTDKADAGFKATGPFCTSDGSKTLVAYTPGGVWSGQGIIDPTTGVFDPATAGAGSHNISYIISGNCGDTVTNVIDVSAALTITASKDTFVCEGNSVQLQANGSTFYNWFPSTTLSSPTIANPIATPTISITYSVTALGNNCPADTDQVTVMVYKNPIVSAGNDQTISVGSSTSLQATGGVNYNWAPATGLTNTSSSNPQASPLQTTTYTVTVTDAHGCSSTDEVTLIVDLTCKEIYLPSAFSPNDDQVNDLFMLRGNCIKELHLYIYDRWGELVFESSDPAFKWNGIYKGQALNSAVFTYVLNAITTNGQIINKKGNVTLVR